MTLRKTDVLLPRTSARDDEALFRSECAFFLASRRAASVVFDPEEIPLRSKSAASSTNLSAAVAAWCSGEGVALFAAGRVVAGFFAGDFFFVAGIGLEDKTAERACQAASRFP